MRKLFYKYFIVYAGLFVILVFGSFFITQMARNLIWNNLITEEKLNLENGVLQFEETISSLQSFSDYTATLEGIGKLKWERGKLRRENYVEMKKVKKQMKDLYMIGNLPYTFLLFRENLVFLSGDQVSGDFEAYYKSFMCADAMSAAEFKEFLFQMPDSVNYVTLDTLQYYDERVVTLSEPLLVVIKPTLSSGKPTEDFCCVFVLAKEDILKYLVVDERSDSTIVHVCDRKGKTLIWYGYVEEAETLATENDGEGDAYQLLNASTSDGMLDFTVGIAYDTVSKQVAKLSQRIYILLAVLVLYTIWAIFFLTWKRYRPTKQMLEHLAEATDREMTISDEYEYVKETTNTLVQMRTNLQKQLSELKREMNNAILSNVLTQGIINERDKDRLKNILPHHLEYYYVIVFCLDEISPESLYEVSQCLMNCFERFYGEYLYALHSEFSETVFLVQQREEDTIDLNEIEQKLKNVARQVTKETDVVFSIGVSGIGRGISGMNIAYEQAKQAYLYTKREHENTAGCYSRIKQEIGNETLEVTSLFRIYDFILAGNKEAIDRSLNRLEGFCEKGGDRRQHKEIFYALSCIVSAAYEKLGFKEDAQQRPLWNAGSTFGSQMAELKAQIFLLIDAYDKNKKSHNTDLKDNILKYMEENYRNPNLTALEVCEAMHISEKYLTQFLKEQTLKSFSKCLEEIRIEKAKEYLRETDWSNMEIAEAVGFGSINTFYRVFNKLEGVTPSSWRKRGGSGQ